MEMLPSRRPPPLAVPVDLFLNLWGGLRLALFLPVYISHFRASLTQVILLAGVSLLLNLGYDAAAAAPEPVFNYNGLTYQATLYLLFFLSVSVIAGACSAPARILPLAALILSVSPTTFLAYAGAIILLERWVPSPTGDLYWGITLLYLFWHLAIVMRVLWKVMRPAPLPAAAMLAAYAAINIAPWLLLPSAPLWTAAAPLDPPVAERRAPADVETLFFRQASLLGGEIRALLPQRPGVIDLYFVGVAGDGSEDVFMNEVQRARRLFDEHFDARGRSLVLVNNPGTFSFLPLANNHNLAAALFGVAERIDPEEDLLVLFITSHGEEGKGLVLDLGDYPLAGLTPRLLRASLSEIGPISRIIIVSACYSGAFIEELRDPRSLVITSARADRNSFGCGHDGPFTYFGEEFIGRSLPEADSFVAAFEQARARIETRETQEGRTPSEPQIYVGAEIQTQLLHFMEQVRSRRAAPPPEGSRGYTRLEQAAGMEHGAVEAETADADESFQRQIEDQGVVLPDLGKHDGLRLADVAPLHQLAQ